MTSDGGLKPSRKQYQHQRYLRRKYAGIVQGEIARLEIEASHFRDQNKIRRHKRWLGRYCKNRPGLALYLSENPQVLKLNVFNRMREAAIREICAREKACCDC